MKVRQGFVSNSSSSSFIVAFKEKPTSVQSVKKQVFGEADNFGHPYSELIYSAYKIASVIFEDIKNQECNNKSDIIETMYRGYGDDDESSALDFIEKNKDKYIYTFSYSDNDGDMFCAMEHGELFGRLEHVAISCH